MQAGATLHPDANAHKEVLPMCLNCFFTYECEVHMTASRQPVKSSEGACGFAFF
jgi:hypothetical protein